MRFVCLCLTLGLVLFLAAPAHAQEALTHGRTVVVLTGLPGDLDSEKSFTEELQALLGILNQPAYAPKRLLLLTDLSALPDLKVAYPLERLDNKRDTFLALAGKIKATDGAPVFIVFGHGGNEGSTPVFHVPGPRLTPVDFAAVAQASPGSTWLIFFPGSSAFAAALGGPQRTILASEAEQLFTVDPISFGLFLNLFKTTGDLPTLAPQLGAATDHWYTSRSLARTEEPALWIDGQPPRKLIGAALAAPVASEMPPVAAPPGEAWKDIQPVAARDYPKSDAILLSRTESYLLDDTEQLVEEKEMFMQILTREGKRFGDFNFSYSATDEDLEILTCEVRRADGQVEPVDPDTFHEGVTEQPENDIQEKHQIFSVPHAEPGSIIHLRLRHTWKRFPLPHLFEDIPLASENPILNFKLEISLPDKSAFHFRFRHQAASDPVITRTNYGTVYRWQFQNVAAQAAEPLSPEGDEPSLAITTFPDWTSFAEWYRRIIRESNLPTPELVARARELTRDAKTDQEKVAAVAQFVTGFRYVSIPLGVNSFRPHAAANVLKNLYGDCKDKANLLDTMLDSLGFKTSLVLVPRFAQAYDDLPGFAFNHAISAVQLNGRTFWIDSTDDVCRLGLLPPGDAGRKVLVVDDPANTLTELPQTVADDHRLSVETTLDFTDAASRVAQAHIVTQTKGYADYLMRTAAQAWSARGKIGPLFDMAFRTASGNFEARQQESTDVADLGPLSTWTSDGPWSGLVSELPQSPVRLVRLPCWLPREWAVATLPRTAPLQLNEGYPMQIAETCTIHLPTGATHLALPTPHQEENSPLTWKVSWSQSSATEVRASLDMTLAQAELDPDAARAFQASCLELQEVLQDGFTFEIR